MDDDVKASDLHTLTDVQVRLSEVAEQLVYAMRIEDMDTFERSTDKLRPLLRREGRMRRERDEQAVTKLVNLMNEELHEEITKNQLMDIIEHISQLHDGKKRLAEVRFMFGPKPTSEYYSEQTDEKGVVLGYISMEPILEDVVPDEEDSS